MTRHAKERMLQRYNTELTDNDLKSIIGFITSYGDNVLYAGSTKNKRKKYYVKLKNIPYKVLLNTDALSVITVFPIDIDEYNNLSDKNVETIKQRAYYLKTRTFVNKIKLLIRNIKSFIREAKQYKGATK